MTRRYQAQFSQIAISGFTGPGRCLTIAALLIFAPSITRANEANKIERLSQECNLGKQKACDELASLAVGEKDVRLRAQAVGKLRDQSLLVKIALSDTDVSVRGSAVGAVTDPAMLTRVAIEGTDANTQQAALAKLNDQQLLGKAAQEAPDSGIRKSATQRLVDQPLLTKISQDDRESGVRDAAKARLADLALLAQTALEAKDPDARIEAIVKLNDQAVLAKIVANDGDGKVREVADIVLTSLQNAALPYADRVHANWSKLHSGLDVRFVFRLLDPMPPSDWDETIDTGVTHLALRMSAAQNQWPTMLRGDGVSSNIVVNFRNPFFDLGFRNGSLTFFQLKPVRNR